MSEFRPLATPVRVSLTESEAECLIHFIAEREGLYRGHAHQFGVEDPLRLVAALCEAHAEAMRERVRELPPLPTTRAGEAYSAPEPASKAETEQPPPPLTREQRLETLRQIGRRLQD